MKTEFLKGLELSEEVIAKIQAESGKDIEKVKAELTKVQEQLTTKETEISELSEQIKTFDGQSSTLEELQSKVKKYEETETARLESEKVAKAESELKDRFGALIGENQFKHADIEAGRLNAFKQALSDESNKGKGDKEIFESITKDLDCFINPQQENIVLPGGSLDTTKLSGVEKAFLQRNPELKI